MIIISAGMQKSGSAYMYNIINDLLVKKLYKDARIIKQKYGMEDVMQWHNNNIGNLDRKTLWKLLLVSFKEGRFAVKTHSGPTRFLKLLVRYGFAKVIYIYRDPRDVVLSVIDHGNRILAKGESHTFAQMATFDKAFAAAQQWARIWESYSQLNNVFRIKYEDMVRDPESIVRALSMFLSGPHVGPVTVSKIVWKYHPKNKEADMTGLHFNKGVVNRHKKELTHEQLGRFENELGDVITRMGYEL